MIEKSLSNSIFFVNNDSIDTPDLENLNINKSSTSSNSTNCDENNFNEKITIKDIQ